METTMFLPLLLLLLPAVLQGQSNADTPSPDIYTALSALKAKVTNLENQHQAQAAKLGELEAQKAEVDKLKQQLQVKQVAFSASLVASGEVRLGPYNTTVPLVFKHVITNIGNAYNPNTGFFIAPVKGAYHFELHICGHGHASYESGAVLVKNEQTIIAASEHQPSHYGTSSNGVTLILEVGDVVFLHQWHHTIISDDVYHHSTFSGHLLFTM